MHRSQGRSADQSMLRSRKKPLQRFTEKASSFILNYDVQSDAVKSKAQIVKFGSLVSRQKHHIGVFKPKP
jgi:hypothetical protein